MKSFKTENRNIEVLPSKKRNNNKSYYPVPIINFPSYHLSDFEKEQVQPDLDYCYVDHNKHTKKNLAANLESVTQGTSDDVDHTQLEEFHEFLKTKDFTYNNLKDITNNKNLVFLERDTA